MPSTIDKTNVFKECRSLQGRARKREENSGKGKRRDRNQKWWKIFIVFKINQFHMGLEEKNAAEP